MHTLSEGGNVHSLNPPILLGEIVWGVHTLIGRGDVGNAEPSIKGVEVYST